jgi:hypothetical protein
MALGSIIAAGGDGSADLFVGLLLGTVLGVLVGPAFRSWQAYREWADASREARLADRLLERMEIEADLDGHASTDPDDSADRSTWQARR